MPDILIYRMKMPENEPLRLVLNPNGQIFVDHGVTFTEYEAVELPEHGDLIDRDAFMNDIQANDYPVNVYGNPASSGISTSGIKRIVNNAPVIIPASKEETE